MTFCSLPTLPFNLFRSSVGANAPSNRIIRQTTESPGGSVNVETLCAQSHSPKPSCLRSGSSRQSICGLGVSQEQTQLFLCFFLGMKGLVPLQYQQFDELSKPKHAPTQVQHQRLTTCHHKKYKCSRLKPNKPYICKEKNVKTCWFTNCICICSSCIDRPQPPPRLCHRKASGTVGDDEGSAFQEVFLYLLVARLLVVWVVGMDGMDVGFR